MREYADIVERVDRDFHQLRAEGVKQKDLEKLKNEVYRLHASVYARLSKFCLHINPCFVLAGYRQP